MSINEVSVAELEVALANGARLVDVRETDEYAAGHVPGAVHVALATVPEHLSAFEDQSVDSALRQSPRERATTHAASDDDNLGRVGDHGANLSSRDLGVPLQHGLHLVLLIGQSLDRPLVELPGIHESI